MSIDYSIIISRENRVGVRIGKAPIVYFPICQIQHIERTILSREDGKEYKQYSGIPLLETYYNSPRVENTEVCRQISSIFSNVTNTHQPEVCNLICQYACEKILVLDPKVVNFNTVGLSEFQVLINMWHKKDYKNVSGRRTGDSAADTLEQYLSRDEMNFLDDISFGQTALENSFNKKKKYIESLKHLFQVSKYLGGNNMFSDFINTCADIILKDVGAYAMYELSFGEKPSEETKERIFARFQRNEPIDDLIPKAKKFVAELDDENKE
jgi:hypothetical protein